MWTEFWEMRRSLQKKDENSFTPIHPLRATSQPDSSQQLEFLTSLCYLYKTG